MRQISVIHSSSGTSRTMKAFHTPVGRCFIFPTKGEMTHLPSGTVLAVGDCLEFDAGESFEFQFEDEATWFHLEIQD